MRATARLALLAVPGACASAPLPTVDAVDLPRFMGDWYVVAHIPAPGEQHAYNGVERYDLQEDGRIATTYVFRKGSFAGEIVVMRPNAVVRDVATNATWGMQFFWPFRFEYLITYLDADYATTIISRSARDYAWVMAREPVVSEARLQELIAILAGQGYDLSKLRRVPHRWPDPELLGAQAR